MKKYFISILMIFLIISVPIGCNSSKTSTEDAKKTTENFFKALYTVEDYTKIIDQDSLYQLEAKISENIKPYTTEKYRNELTFMRAVYNVPKMAFKYKANMELGKINLSNEAIDKEANTVTYDCILNINLKDSNGKLVKSFEKKTTIKLIKENDTYKLSAGDVMAFNWKAD